MKPEIGCVATNLDGVDGIITRIIPARTGLTTFPPIYMGTAISPGYEGKKWETTEPSNVRTFQDFLNRHEGGASGL